MKKLLLLSLPLLAFSAPANAEVPAGFRLELMVGYDEAKAELFTATAGREQLDGVAYGAGVGYDVPLGGALAIGLDGELTLASTDILLGTTGELDIQRDWYVGGRVTAMVSENISVYAKAGYTNLNVDFSRSTNVPTVVGNLDGGRVGVGFQVSSDERTFFGAEARYSRYEDGLLERRQIMGTIGTRF